ncbi:MAG: hypothetical protein RLZ86_735 [Actinomycetota bacterium]
MSHLANEHVVVEWFLVVLDRCRLIDPRGHEVRVTPLQRILLTRLALAYPGTVSIDGLIEVMWSSDPPRTARAALHNQVSRLRTTTFDRIIVSEGDGYRLGIASDIDRLASTVRVADTRRRSKQFAEAYELAENMISILAGNPVDHLEDVHRLEGEKRRLIELIHSLEVIRLESAIETGRKHWSIGEAERLVALHPFDETCWLLLARVLRESGRSGDALGAIDRARRTLRSSLGIEPGPLLQEYEHFLIAGTARPSTPEVPFEGRRNEITNAIDAAVRCESTVVLGERGAGKSRFLHQLRVGLRAKNFLVVDAACRLDSGTVASTLHDLTEALGGDLATWDDPVKGFIEIVREASRDRPVALLLDDLHNAGPTTALALDHVRHLQNVSLVATIDTAVAELIHPMLGDVTWLTLPPLTDEDVATSIQRLFPQITPGDPRVPWLRKMSGGNPLLLHLICDELASNPTWSSGGIPLRPGLTSLDAIVQERLSEVGSLGRLAAEVTALAGRNATRGLVTHLAPDLGLQACLRHGLVTEGEDGSLRFTHDAISLVIAEQITTGRRAEIHRQLARLLPPDAVHDIAFHLLRSGGSDLVTTFEAVERAAKSTSEKGAHLDAAALHQDFLTIVVQHRGASDPMSIRSAIRWGDSLRLAGDPKHQEVLRECVRAAVASEDSSLIVEAAQAFVQLGASSDDGEVNDEAIAVTELALSHLQGEEWAVLAAAMCVALALFGDPERVRAVFLDAESLAQSSAVRRAVLPAAYLSLGHPVDLNRRVELTTELMQLAEQARDPQAMFEANQLQFSNCLQLADGIGLRRALDGLRRLADETGDVGRRWEHLYCAAAVAHLDADLARAEQLADEAYALFAPLAPARAGAAWLSQILIIRLHQERLGEMVEPLSMLTTAQPEVAAWPALLAGVLAFVDHDRASQLAREALVREPEDFTWLPRLLFASRAAVSSGDPKLVDDYIAVLAPWTGLIAWQGTCAFGPVDAALADLQAARGDETKARRHRMLARDVADRLGAPVFMSDG